jgi:hypothetical protein
MLPYQSDQAEEGGGILLRAWSHDSTSSCANDKTTSLLQSVDGKVADQGPKFQPGDHIIRWKLLKLMLWPIQVHGIVLSVEKNNDSNNSMNTSNSSITSSSSSSHLESNAHDGNYKYTIADFGYTSSQSLDEKKEGGGKNIFNRMGNINDKMKTYYQNSFHNNSPDRASIMEKDSFFDETPDNSPDRTSSKTRNADSNAKDSSTNINNTNLDATFDIDSERAGVRKRFQIIEITNRADLKKWHKIEYGKSLFQKGGGFTKKLAKSSRNLMDKLKLDKLNLDKLKLDKLSFRKNKKNDPNNKYSSVASGQTENESGVSGASPTGLNDETPKLPKSDPRTIVLARTQYIIDQQELPEAEQTLPPYHILYSNSECLAVWCKTGHFSTLQAAVFLHSTAVGNAKSTFIMTGAVAATQPWLIPVVGIYGAVAVGMPYLLLKKCKDKWKTSESELTDGFWSTADPEVYVAAIENWSGIDSSIQEGK